MILGTPHLVSKLDEIDTNVNLDNTNFEKVESDLVQLAYIIVLSFILKALNSRQMHCSDIPTYPILQAATIVPFLISLINKKNHSRCVYIYQQHPDRWSQYPGNWAW